MYQDREFYENVAKDNGLMLSDKTDLVIKGLTHNKIIHGEYHCPCVSTHNHSNDTICPCKEFRDTKHCHCGMFIK